LWKAPATSATATSAAVYVDSNRSLIASTLASTSGSPTTPSQRPHHPIASMLAVEQSETTEPPVGADVLGRIENVRAQMSGVTAVGRVGGFSRPG